MKSQDFKVRVNDHFEFENLRIEDLDIIPAGNHCFHILYHDKSFLVEVLDADQPEKAFRIKVNGTVYEVQLSDQYDQMVHRLGLAAMSSQQVKDIKAPMPGLVLEVAVKPGDSVQKGAPLIILEAMKMENVIKSPGDGQVKAVQVKKGQAVEKNQLLIEMG